VGRLDVMTGMDDGEGAPVPSGAHRIRTGSAHRGHSRAREPG